MNTDGLKKKANDLGSRMAAHGYDLSDNPYTGIHGACAKAWHEGYSGMLLAMTVSRSKRYAPLGK